MKYKGIVELDVRKYLGAVESAPNWEHVKYAIGININGIVYDYKTLEEYSFLDRNEKGIIEATKKELIPGKVYAINRKCEKFDFEQRYNQQEIDQYINSFCYFSDEYKNLKPKVKTLFKKR